jgi:hypothetical protein
MNDLVGLLRGHQAPPADVVEIPRRLGVADVTLVAAQPERFRVAPSARPRAPLAHYHQIPYRRPIDLGNDCTTSGCHPLLPHGQRVEVRSFLNMHASILDCMVCHATEDTGPVEIQWFDLRRQQPTGPPAIVQLAARLAESEGRQAGHEAELSAELQSLLEEALLQAGDVAPLGDWLLRLRTTHPRGALWNSIVAQMRREIDTFTFTDASAKLCLVRAGQRLGTPDDRQRAAATRLRTGGAGLAAGLKEELLQTVHRDVVKRQPQCSRCHAPEGGFIDLTALGYPPARVQALQHSVLARQVESIEAGRPFHLPALPDAGPAGR